MNLLDELLAEMNEREERIKREINMKAGEVTRWKKNSKSYYILSPSAKEKNGFQLTFFFEDVPVSDKVRYSKTDFDIVMELAQNDCYLIESKK